MIKKIRQSIFTKIFSLVMIPMFLMEIFLPWGTSVALASPVDSNLMGGGESSEMVDLSTGDFTYSIPLVDVGGYPVSLSYDANITMDQEASMVGLGWSINVGAINRMVKGLPDDFNGDKVKTTMNLRPKLFRNNSLTLSGELAGNEEISNTIKELLESHEIGIALDFGWNFDNYIGGGTSFGISGSYQYKFSDIFSTGLNGGINSSSKNGLSSNLGANISLGETFKGGLGLGLSKNSLYGSSLNASFSLTASHKYSKDGKDRKASGRFSLGGSYPLGSQSYTPTANFDFDIKSYSFDIDGGILLGVVFPHLKYYFSKTTVCLKENYKENPAYGYLNLEKGYSANALQDFNLSLSSIHDKTNHLPSPNPTFDVYYMSGGAFRAIRNDAGYVKDPISVSNTNGLSFSGEGGIGIPLPPLAHIGVNTVTNSGDSKSGEWSSNSFSSTNSFKYKETFSGSNTYTEKYSFVTLDNGSTINPIIYNSFLGNTPVSQNIAPGTLQGLNTFSNNAGGNYNVTDNDHFYNERRNRGTVILNHSNQEAIGLGKGNFKNYTLLRYNFSTIESSNKARTSTDYPSHQIGEFVVYGSGESQEVYGIPVMNTTTQVSFNISEIHNYETAPPARNLGDITGYINYNPGVDNSTDNRRGDNNFYLKNEVPTHATAYLLTEILSENYSDLTGDGCTPDDLGDYVKFNHSYHGKAKWRFPYEQNTAAYNENFKSNPLDDMANYSYGERDVWYLHSIESKEYIAEFVYGVRHDAWEVIDENGGRSSGINKSKYLREIKLYTRKGKELGEPPLKTVHFVYDYSLCQDTPDNDDAGLTTEDITNNVVTANQGGKLTLKQVYFTYQESNKGKLHKYNFDYGNPANAVQNPAYQMGDMERWGFYKKNTSGAGFEITDPLNNMEYPYAEQNKTNADQNVLAWKLKAIDLPTGSRIEVEYESDNYHYIQNKVASKMASVEGLYSSTNTPSSIVDLDGTLDLILSNTEIFNPEIDQNWFGVSINLPESIDGGLNFNDANYLCEKFYLPEKVGANRFLYYNMLINLAPHKKKIIDPNVYEYIQGYCKILNWWVYKDSPSGDYTKVFIQVNHERINATDGFLSLSEKVHPISRKAWQVVKDALPLVLYPIDDFNNIYAKDASINCDLYEEEESDESPDFSTDSKNHKKNMLSIPNIYKMMLKTGYASRYVKNKSWFRLKSGNKSKIGGGHRVKEIKIYDNWNDFKSGENTSVYGTKYEYNTINKENGISISSGVASYEPIGTGADENSLRYPMEYIHNQKGVPNERYYSEFPQNEEIYSSAQIKYSRVKVSSIEYEGLEKNTPGYTIYEHYTAKDFPLEIKNMKMKAPSSNPVIKSLLGFGEKRIGFSHGNAIVMNDMHGKFKSKKVYNANHQQIYRMEHYYKTNTSNKLVSNVNSIVSNGGYDNTNLKGLQVDIMTYISQNTSKDGYFMGGAGVDLPIAPHLSMSFGNNINEVYTTLTTKIIQQNGILNRVVVEDNGKTKLTNNLLYDNKTGMPIVTEVRPEVTSEGHTIYQYDYPAYWAYPRMGMSSDNINLRRKNIVNTVTPYEINSADEPHYIQGDELLVTEVTVAGMGVTINSQNKYWVVKNETSGDFNLLDIDGDVFVPNTGTGKMYLYKTIKSGKKNLMGALMQTITTLERHPGFTSPYTSAYEHEKIINISALEYSDTAQIRTGQAAAEIGLCGVYTTKEINPYVWNRLGQWYALNSFVYDSVRTYATGDSRKDGILTEYIPFWRLSGGGNWAPIYASVHPNYLASNLFRNWLKTEQVTIIDQYGYNLEVQDALGLYSAIYTGYNQSLQTAQVVNSRYAESGFDSFEDYFSDGVGDHTNPFYETYGPNCVLKHFRACDPRTSSYITTEEAHTGRYSLKVDPTFGNFKTVCGTVWDGVEPTPSNHGIPYVTQDADLINTHRVLIGKQYVLTVWVKEQVADKNILSYENNYVSILVNGSPLTPTYTKKSNIIDGWQRIEILFTVPPTATDGESLHYRLGIDGNTPVYFDDLRVQPYDSEMVSYVVDPTNLRMVAKLDSRNFATIYQYDEEGTMIRVIQETERGKFTIQENRSGIKIK